MVRSSSTVSLASIKSQKKKGFEEPKLVDGTTGMSLEHHISASSPTNETNQSESTPDPNSTAPSKETDASAETDLPQSMAASSTPSKDNRTGSNQETPIPSPIIQRKTGKTLTMSQSHSSYETSGSSSICQGQNISRSSAIIPPPPQYPVGRMLNNVELFMHTTEWAEGGKTRVRECK